MRCFILWRMWVPRGNVPCIIHGIIHAIIHDTCRHRSGPLTAGFQPTAIPTPLRPRIILLESVQKPSTIITSDYIKFPAQNSSTKCTSFVYWRRNSYPRVRSWAIAFTLLNCVSPSYPLMLRSTIFVWLFITRGK